MQLSRLRAFALAALALALIIAAGCGAPAADRAKVDNLVVNVIDVGQGDAILIRTPRHVTLIDSGDVPARDKLVAYIKKQGVTTIDTFIVTHPHADHIGGAVAILDNFAVKQVYDSGQTTTSALYRQYLTTVRKKNIPFALLAAGQEVDIGGAALKILNPPVPPIAGDAGLNNNSIVARLIYGNFAMLLAGDAEREAEAAMVKKYGAAGLKSQVLKSGHHGSRTSSSPAFMKAVAPEAAVISVGAGNEYHHPHPSILKRYGDQKLKLYRTDTDGTVTVASDGKTYTITKER
ncbi:ComEC/Rec2 family competence protein [Anaeroselena agilis]|uniref:ComEC/Rec2 family competence protein n=1 Tax=Anaeroselena agilis TaxID=3063788 RepID=A0ABU3NV42_9FIRM|nr:ComEC/Rec2 family competence protein [Selenomonadales bacterium 4137-cl]